MSIEASGLSLGVDGLDEIGETSEDKCAEEDDVRSITSLEPIELRQDLSEQLRERFSLTPARVRLKAALLFAGVRYHPSLVEAGEWAFPNFMPFHLPLNARPYRGARQVAFPYLLKLDDETQVRLRIKEDSPFSIRPAAPYREGEGWVTEAGEQVDAGLKVPPTGYPYILYEGEDELCRLTFEPRLPWSEALTADGTPFKAIGLSQHGDMLVLNPAPGCEYFVAPFGHEKKNLSCQFCLYGLPDQRMRPLGQELFKAGLPDAQLARICEACAHTETHARHLYLVSGSMVDMRQEGERFVQLARALNARGLHERYYVACGSGAIPKEAMREMKALGVRGASFNLEVWDPKQFERVCPGKAHYVGRDRWLGALEDAVEVFGKGNVMSAFVGGAELDGEGGFQDPADALASNIEGAQHLLSRGVQPVFSLHWKMTGKQRGLEPLYNLETFLALNEQLAELRKGCDHLINEEFFCKRCAYMQLEPDYDAHERARRAQLLSDATHEGESGAHEEG